jgi:nucleoside-diphosphate-sugar epimerase
LKKVLITGASGTIGLWTIKYLLSEGKYEITVLDLKSKENYKKLNKYRRRVNIIYGDVTNQILIDSLIKEHDFIIHLAGINPPVSNLNTSFGSEIDYKGLENIIRSINYYNPNCFLIYPSTTTMYQKSTKELGISSPIKYSKDDYYSEIKEKCEKRIKEKLKNYVIFRIPFILGDLKYAKSIYLYKQDEMIETITDRDVAYALAKSISYDRELNKSIKILSGGAGCRINSSELLLKILNTYGYSANIIWNKLFNPYKYDGNIYKKDKKLTEMLGYQNDSIDSYFMRLSRTTKKRNLARLIAVPKKRKLERKYLK